MCQSKAQGGKRCDGGPRGAIAALKSKEKVLDAQLASFVANVGDEAQHVQDLHDRARVHQLLELAEKEKELLHSEEGFTKSSGVIPPAANNIEVLFEADDAKEALKLLADSISINNPRADHLAFELTKSVDADMAHVKALIASGDVSGMSQFIDERVNCNQFVQATTMTRELRGVLDSEKQLYKYLLDAQKNGEDVNYDQMFDFGQSIIEKRETLALLNGNLDLYREPTAIAVAERSRLREIEERAAGTFIEYTDDTLNRLEAIGDFPSGSREWLESRQNGVGGSDVGDIIRVDPDYGYQNLKETLASKVNPISDEDVAEQSKGRSFTTATGRGNAWEGEILHQFSQNNPDITVGHCKTSWRNADHSFQNANFDGLMFDENGKPDGIVEIKTGSDLLKWGDPSEGIEGIPKQYRAQVLWYMQAGGFKRGALAVMLNDREYREYHFALTPELENEQRSNLYVVNEFWDKVKEGLRDPSTLAPRPIRGGFPLASLRDGYKDKETVLRTLALYREETPEQVIRRFKQLLPTQQDRCDPDLIEQTFHQMYMEYDPATRQRPIVGVDIEASSLGQTSGRIIETGITVRNPITGKEIRKIKRLHGMSEKARRGNGVGAEEIHHISLNDIKGKDPFSERRNQERLLEIFKSGTMLAHNAAYEDKWFRAHLRGYAEARDKGKIQLMDSMLLFRHLAPDSKNYKLSSMVEYTGAQYVGQHRAFADAAMMTEAFFRLQDKVRSGEQASKTFAGPIVPPTTSW